MDKQKRRDLSGELDAAIGAYYVCPLIAAMTRRWAKWTWY